MGDGLGIEASRGAPSPGFDPPIQKIPSSSAAGRHPHDVFRSDVLHTQQGDPPWLDVVIEIPRGSFLKRGSNGSLDFVSPLPCPYNYGSVPGLLGLEGDLLDALVLGPRVPCGQRLRVRAYGAVGLWDRALYDDKLVCATCAPSPAETARVLRFMRVYGWAKRLLNLLRGRRGATASAGWCTAAEALARARPVPSGARSEPAIGF